jgi:cell division control protein 6
MRDIIEDELFTSSVIKNHEYLDFDYVPEELPHRDDQLRILAQLFKPILTRIAQNVVIKGPVGTGKTVLIKKFCRKIVSISRKRGIIIEYIHLNCRKRSTDTMVLFSILTHFDPRFPDRGFSVQEMLDVLRRQLQRREAHLILVLDEADALLKRSGSNIIYSLTRFSDDTTQSHNPISIIMISQKDVLAELDQAALSTFKRSNTINLDKYGRNELLDIINQRVDLAFHKGTVLHESIDLIADIASEWGDARFAIELLWKAGLYTDHNHEQLVIPEYIRAAKAETYSVVTETKLKNLQKHHLLTLISIAKRLQRTQAAYVTTGEIEKIYAITCEEYDEKPRGHTMFWKYLKEIEQAGFIQIKISGKGQLGTTQLVSLPDIPAKVLNEKLQSLL